VVPWRGGWFQCSGGVEWAAVRVVVARRDARGDLGNDGDEGQRVVAGARGWYVEFSVLFWPSVREELIIGDSNSNGKARTQLAAWQFKCRSRMGEETLSGMASTNSSENEMQISQAYRQARTGLTTGALVLDCSA
jgi:hypothetical protein